MTWQESYAQWRPEFAKAMDERLYTMEWVDERVRTGDAQFFSTDKAAIVTELKIYPTGWVEVHGLLAAGDLGDLENVLIPQAERFGQSAGAGSARIESREGWAKVMAKHGYSLFQVAIWKVF